jgi:hypothetical protein
VTPTRKAPTRVDHAYRMDRSRRQVACSRAGEAIRSQPGAVRRAQHVVALAALLPPNGN